MTKSYRKPQKYSGSEQLAYENGFRAHYDDNAFNGRYFFKKGLKWIHNIGALKYVLGVCDDKELEEEGYDVETYYALH